MAIRQYIGARYIPRFMGTFVVTQQYEVLDVVDNGMGTSYILKNPAPVGTPLTDTDYWAIYGATNGAIIHLQNQIDDLSDYANKEGDLVIISASYGNSPSINNNFITQLIPMVNTIYDHVYWSTVGGDSFHNGGYLAQLQHILPTVDNADHVKMILVGGIGNDAGVTYDTDVLPAMITFLNYANTNFPNAKIVLLPFSVKRHPQHKRLTYQCYNNMLNTETQHHMALMPDLYNILTRNYSKYVGSDGLHPNADGAILLANAIFNILTTGGYEFSTNGTEYIGDGLHDLNPDLTYDNGGFMWWHKDNENTKAYYKIGFTPTSNLTVTHYSNIANSVLLSETKVLQSFNEYDSMCQLIGTIGYVESGAAKYRPCRGIIWYDSAADKYFIHLFGTVSDFTLQSNVHYELELNGIIPITHQ